VVDYDQAVVQGGVWSTMLQSQCQAPIIPQLKYCPEWTGLSQQQKWNTRLRGHDRQAELSLTVSVNGGLICSGSRRSI
jgi:hypothetical protein